MRGAEGIVLAFSAFCEPGQSTTLPQRPNPVTTTRQDFVRISLMTNVPEQLVMRGVEQVMESDREFHDAEPCSQVSTCYGNCANRLGSQFVGQLPQLLHMEATQIGRTLNAVEKQRGSSHIRVLKVGGSNKFGSFHQLDIRRSNYQATSRITVPPRAVAPQRCCRTKGSHAPTRRRKR